MAFMIVCCRIVIIQQELSDMPNKGQVLGQNDCRVWVVLGLDVMKVFT